MEKLQAAIVIKAPRSKVWDVMLSDATYREWTKAFGTGSRFVGDWSEGSNIRFIGVTEEGKEEGGMVSRIKENRPHEFLSIEHLGIIKDGVDDMTSEEARKWTPAFENYTFIDVEGGTELTVDMDVDAEYLAMFSEMWLNGLASLKDLVERS